MKNQPNEEDIRQLKKLEDSLSSMDKERIQDFVLRMKSVIERKQYQTRPSVEPKSLRLPLTIIERTESIAEDWSLSRQDVLRISLDVGISVMESEKHFIEGKELFDAHESQYVPLLERLKSDLDWIKSESLKIEGIESSFVEESLHFFEELLHNTLEGPKSSSVPIRCPDNIELRAGVFAIPGKRKKSKVFLSAIQIGLIAMEKASYRGMINTIVKEVSS